MQNSSAKNLIIDVRGNEGGDDDTRNELLSYLIRQPFGCANPEQKIYRYLRVPNPLLPYLQTWNEDFKKPKDSLQYVSFADNLYKPKAANCSSIEPKPKAFTGKVYVLIDAKNSSTTFTMADLLQTTQAATLIGEKTGGTKQGLNGSQFFFLHLPYSHLEIDIPLVWQAPTRPRTDCGVIPDHEVLTIPADLLHNNDRQLNYTLSLIKNREDDHR
ncbi:S41 family peptidase [Adhaeribacter pallidiroseus]|uniref:Tail specific protease domain-containing protein n=1 Tax=Adhaeribacter pallidiroseus TaxID=2072847 RepID=A0A369QL56_9BACT|nr:S41 family peptidase [Adhaeribacter pallidiroseus]RDC65454.1 hypothetical protein AHMF7616_04084 [Adhaeribacter pallidiroseus]